MHSAAITSVFGRAALWSLALLSVLFPGVLAPATLWGVLAGAALGAIGGIMATRRAPFSWRQQALFSLAGFALLGGVEVWRDLAAPLGPSFSQALALCLGAGGLVFTMEVLRGLAMPFRIAQSLLFVGAAIQAGWPHRHGHLERPYWLVERLIEAGLGPEMFWKAVAFVLLAGALLILKPPFRQAATFSMKRTAVGALITLLFFSGLWFALPQPSARPAADPPPPHAPDAPPPPPPPEKIAVVRFSDFCAPTDYTDDAYLFYRKPASELTAPSAAPEEDAPLSRTQTPLKTQVLLFSRDEQVPMLMGSHRAEVLSSFDASRFQAAWEVSALFPRGSTRGPSYLEMPAERQLGKLEETLWQGIFEGTQIRASKGAALIKEVLEKAGKLSEKGAIPPEKWNLERFVFENTTGSALNFATAAAELLRTAGLESRVVSGLRYDPGKGGAFHFKEVIILTEAHSAYWAEWRVPGDEWHPLAIHPQTVLDDAPPPQAEEDLENLLAKETPPKNEAAAQKVGSEGNGALQTAAWALLMLFVAMSLLAIGTLIDDLAFGIEPEAIVFKRMRQLLYCTGWRFDPWQDWEGFERQLSQTRPTMARHFGEVRKSLENIRWELRQPRPKRGRLLAIFIQFVFCFLLFPKSSRPPVTATK